MSLLYHGVWKSQKKSHFTTSRTKRATFIFSPSIDDLEPFLCFEVNTDHENWPFNFVNIKGLQVWSVLFSLHKKVSNLWLKGKKTKATKCWFRCGNSNDTYFNEFATLCFKSFHKRADDKGPFDDSHHLNQLFKILWSIKRFSILVHLSPLSNQVCQLLANLNFNFFIHLQL